MYILVEIIHTEFQYISLIEMQKYHQPGQKGAPGMWRWQPLLSRLPTGTKEYFLSRLGNRDKKGFPIGTTLMFCSSVVCTITMSFFFLFSGSTLW